MANLNVNKQWEVLSWCTGQLYGTTLRFLDNGTGPISAIWPTANLAIYVPFVLRAATTFQQGFWENGSVTSGSADMAVYDENLVKLWSAGGTIAQSGAGAVPQAFTITNGLKLQPGRYWVGLVADNITAQYRPYTNAGTASCSALHKAVGCQQQTLASPVMPSSPTFATAVNNYVPQMGLYQLSLAM